ncbi:hypothetical protein DICVIV_05426 [Dictyocaulus viviparus]|uniref:Uncharacterized protein n=1 Tax=Dictyocaulus viviparus TaxID=29172 RepID=A0A0D8Y1H5_DICVI|nr:hypothetical protein DICVIV_05426 [Dictyocaulus viviparus]
MILLFCILCIVDAISHNSYLPFSNEIPPDGSAIVDVSLAVVDERHVPQTTFGFPNYAQHPESVPYPSQFFIFDRKTTLNGIQPYYMNYFYPVPFSQLHNSYTDIATDPRSTDILHG